MDAHHTKLSGANSGQSIRRLATNSIHSTVSKDGVGISAGYIIACCDRLFYLQIDNRIEKIRQRESLKFLHDSQMISPCLTIFLLYDKVK